MYYRGGILRFGKLTMEDADLALIDWIFEKHAAARLEGLYAGLPSDRAVKLTCAVAFGVIPGFKETT